MDLPHGISSTDELRDDHAGGSNSGQKGEGDYYGLEQVMSFVKDHAAFSSYRLQASLEVVVCTQT